MPHAASAFRVGRMTDMVRMWSEEGRHRCGLSPLGESHLPIHKYREISWHLQIPNSKHQYNTL